MRSRTLFAAAALLAAWPALAQGPGDSMTNNRTKGDIIQPPMTQEDVIVEAMTRRGMFGSGPMLGMHIIPVTVTAVNAQAGVVEGIYGKMPLKLHFPPSSLGVVKTGDHLSVLLSFSK
jgi:hypothetical protein